MMKKAKNIVIFVFVILVIMGGIYLKFYIGNCQESKNDLNNLPNILDRNSGDGNGTYFG